MTKFILERIRVKWGNFKVRKTGKAYNTLAKAMRDDPDFAWSWHCNIAMPLLDNLNRGSAQNFITATEANEMACILMKHLFDVETKEPFKQLKK